MYLEQLFESGKYFIGRGVARMCFAHKKLGSVSTEKLFLECGGQEHLYKELRSKYEHEHTARTFVEHDVHLKEKKQ